MADKKAVYDLDAAVAEDGAEPFQFTFGGEGYTLAAEFDVLAASKLADGHLEEALARLLGDEQWARVQASSAVLGHRTLQKLLTAYQKHVGLVPGE